MKEGNHDLVICNSSQWSASLLKDSYRFSQYPRCMADNIEVILVEDHEKYSISIDKVRGFDVEFSEDRTKPTGHTCLGSSKISYLIHNNLHIIQC